jgi:hypothetical protein
MGHLEKNVYKTVTVLIISPARQYMVTVNHQFVNLVGWASHVMKVNIKNTVQFGVLKFAKYNHID